MRRMHVLATTLLLLVSCVEKASAAGATIAVAFKVVGTNQDLVDVTDRINNPDNTFDIFEQRDDYLFIGSNQTGWNRLEFTFQNDCAFCSSGSDCNACPAGASQCCALGGARCNNGLQGVCYRDPRPRQYAYSPSYLGDDNSQDRNPSDNADDTTRYLTTSGVIKNTELLVPTELCIPTLMTKWTEYELWPMYWIAYKRLEGNSGSFVPNVKSIRIVDSAVMTINTSAVSITGFIDQTPLQSAFVITNEGTASLQWTAAFSPDFNNEWSVVNSAGSPTLDDVPADSSATFYIRYSPTVAESSTSTLTLTCQTCTSGITRTIAVLGKATVPVHFRNLTIPAAGKYGLGSNLVFRAYYDTVVAIDDSRASIDARLQKGTAISGAVIGTAVLSTPVNSNTTYFDFVFAVDDQVPDNRVLFVTSSKIEPGIITKISTGIPLTGPDGNEANAAFANPNPTGIEVDGTRPSVRSVSVRSGFYTVGQQVVISANFSEPVVLSGAASGVAMSIDVQGGALSGSAVSQSGYQEAWTFLATVPADVEDRNGVSLLSLVQTSSQFLDGFQNPAFASVPANFFPDVLIDSKAPTVSSWSVSPTGPSKNGAGAAIVFTAVLSETVDFSAVKLRVVVGGSTFDVDSSSVSPSTQISTFFVVPSDATGVVTSATLLYAYVRDIGSQNDLTGAVAVPAGQIEGITIDTTPPTVLNVIFSGGSVFTTGERLDFFVNFSEPVALEGLVTLAFTVGSASLSTDDVVTVGGSPRLLLFRYTVPIATRVLEGITSIRIEASGSAFGSSRILDIQGAGSANSMPLPATNLPFDASLAASIVIDGTAPALNSTSNTDSNGSSGAASELGGIIGGVVAALVVIGLVFVAFVSWRRYKKYQEEKLPDFQKHAFQLDEKAGVSKSIFSDGLRDSHKQLRDVMMDCDEMLPYVIAGGVPTAKLNEAVKAIIYLYKSEGREDKALAFIKRCVTMEVQKAMAGGKSNLFRTNNVATKSMAVYLRMVGLPYLWHCIGEVVSSTSMMSVELDPTRLTNGDTDSDLSRYTLLQMTQQQFVSILRKLHQMPADLRAIARHLDAEVRAAGQGEDGDSLAQVALAGMVFLRYFCPAISAPTAFGFMDERPPADKRRTLTLVTKTLQNLANGVQFGGKEPYMEKLNDFIASNRAKMQKYLSDVVGHDVKSTEEIPGPAPPAHAKTWSLDVLMKIISGSISDYKGKLSPVLVSRLRHILAADLLPLPPKAHWVKAGWMTKQGGGTSVGGKRNWKDRFFVLQGAYLWYTKEEVTTGESGVMPLGQICLDGCSVITTNDGSNGFMIDHPHMRTYYLRMESKEEVEKWVSALGRAIDDLRRDPTKDSKSNPGQALRMAPIQAELVPLSSSTSSNIRGEADTEEGPLSARFTRTSSDQVASQSGPDYETSMAAPLCLGVPAGAPSGRRSVLVAAALEEKKQQEMDDEEPGMFDDRDHVMSKWTTHQTDDGATYYYNTETGETSWEKPIEPATTERKTSVPSVLPNGWVMFIDDESGLPYYHNSSTGQTLWEPPA